MAALSVNLDTEKMKLCELQDQMTANCAFQLFSLRSRSELTFFLRGGNKEVRFDAELSFHRVTALAPRNCIRYRYAVPWLKVLKLCLWCASIVCPAFPVNLTEPLPRRLHKDGDWTQFASSSVQLDMLYSGK